MTDGKVTKVTDEKVTCCGIIEELATKYSLPFYRPMSINLETGDLNCKEWAVKCQNLTLGGNISKKAGSHVTAYLNYCPFCGKRITLRKEKSQDSQDEEVSNE